MKRSWWVGLSALPLAYAGSAALAVPGLPEGALTGSLVHASFGKSELLQLVVLTALTGVAAGRWVGRWRWPRAAVFAAGLVFISAGLFVAEGRWQRHGFIAEHVIASRVGEPWQVFAGAGSLVGLGALVCRMTPVLTPARRRPPRPAASRQRNRGRRGRQSRRNAPVGKPGVRPARRQAGRVE